MKKNNPNSPFGQPIDRREFLRRSMLAGAGLGTLRLARPSLRITASNSPANSAIASVIDQFMTMHNPVGLAVAVIQPDNTGKPHIQTFFRGEIQKGTGATPDATTIFELGSLTKTFTATLLADLVFNRKLLALTDDVQPYYDKLAPGVVTLPTYNNQTIKFIHLATHTAGFPDDPPNLKEGGLCAYTPPLMYEALNSLTLPQAPGEVALYSNLGFGTLADILSLIADHQPYESVIRGLLNKAKLLMPDTHIMTADFTDPRFAQGYMVKSIAGSTNTGDVTATPTPATQVKLTLAPQCMPTWPAFNGAGALHATLNDMIAWTLFNMGLSSSPLTPLVAQTQRQQHSFGTSEFVGLAWQLRPIQAKSAKFVVTKNGGTLGFSTDITFFPKTGTGVIALCNTTNTPVTALNGQLIQLLNGMA